MGQFGFRLKADRSTVPPYCLALRRPVMRFILPFAPGGWGKRETPQAFFSSGVSQASVRSHHALLP
jgi:hypothetical protein